MLQEGATSTEAVNRVGQLLKKNATLCQKEKKVRESLYGSHVLSICAQLSRNQAQALDTNLASFDVNTFADGILNLATDREQEKLDWNLMFPKVQKLFHRAPGVSYLYGSFKAEELPRKEPKERAPRKQAARAAAEKQPEKVTNVAAADEGNDKAVQHLKKVLKRKFRENGDQPISFFECVLDPTSFHRTVENIFHLSFLMKNNFCAIRQENGNGLPYIHKISAAEVGELLKGKKLQCIASISPEMWQTLVKVFEIRQPMVPPLT
ncbi:hypothetical protein FOCC_FOCC015754 [Frankliniella occidentalis]|nr:hypothetical protein FOCC_FOCC015754 [Frankliniella occidentalis]